MYFLFGIINFYTFYSIWLKNEEIKAKIKKQIPCFQFSFQIKILTFNKYDNLYENVCIPKL